ncbi:hypothetical protein [Methylobacterium nigriterrae]
MSLRSIAQYLPPNQTLFDLVIFDEASRAGAAKAEALPVNDRDLLNRAM